jgi:hypothetical protein
LSGNIEADFGLWILDGGWWILNFEFWMVDWGEG